MRFLVDENVGPSVALWLAAMGHNVVSVYLEARGLSDDQVIQESYEEHRVLITCDKDFGDLVFRERRSHGGVVLLRLEDERPAAIVRVLGRLLDKYADQLGGRFVVVTEDHVRFAGLSSDADPR